MTGKRQRWTFNRAGWLDRLISLLPNGRLAAIIGCSSRKFVRGWN